MIDLHMHTKYSDGQFSVRELIDILNREKIRIASITDHNSCDAHVEYRNQGYKDDFNGIMIPGTELQTIKDRYLIEVLIYGYDIDEFKRYVDETRKTFWEFHHEAYQELLKKARELGLKYIEPNKPLENGYYCNMKFQEAIQACSDENRGKIPDRILDDHLYFYRHEFQNPNSMFFIDNTKAFPNIDDVIRVAHDCHGLAILAHIDEYQSIEDKESFLDNLISTTDIDGMECFHPSISEDNREKYIKYAIEHGLLISAGSDFHGSHLAHRRGINTEAKMEDVSVLKKILK